MDAKVFPVTRDDAEWRRILTPEQYDVMPGHGSRHPAVVRCCMKSALGGFRVRGVVNLCLNHD